MPAPAQTRTAHVTCPLCEASCGLAVDIDLTRQRIVRIRGDRDDVWSRGHICPKGASLADVQHDPDRLLHPIRRVGDTWHEVGWDEALDEIADRFDALRRAHGPHSVAVFLGNPTAHDYSSVLFALLTVKVLGTHNVFTSNSVDALPRMLTSLLMYGSQALIPIPDLDHTDFMLMLGANPVVSNGSAMAAPDIKGRLRRLKERGGRLVTVDPRRTETAAFADTHLFIKPGTDALLLLALLHVVLSEGLARPGRLQRWLPPSRRGLGRVRTIVAAFPPSRVAPIVGIDADTITTLARDFATARSAVCYGRMGTCVQAFGTLTTWLIDVLNIATGNLDRVGGAMFTTPAVDLAQLAGALGQSGHFGRWRSRVSGLPEFSGELPVAAFAEELDTPGEGQPRGLLVHAGNPVLSVPNGPRLERAMEKLDFMVCVDIYRNETSRYADLILPTSFGVERDEYALLPYATAVRNVTKYSEPVLDPPPGVRHSWTLLLDLCTRLLRRRGVAGAAAARALDGLVRRIGGPPGILAAALRLGPHGKGSSKDQEGLTLERLRGARHGIDLGPLEPRLPGVLRTRPRRIQLVPEDILDEIPRARALLNPPPPAVDDEPKPAADPLRLLSRRQLRSNNSWMHNSRKLTSGRPRCTLQVHPDDARARDLADGDTARVVSRVGAIEAPVEITTEVMPGVVSLPHGWGHDRPGVALSVAAKVAGVSINDVMDETAIDRLSGCSDLSGVDVIVTRASAT